MSANEIEIETEKPASVVVADQGPKSCQLPLARIKNIMKLDSDLNLASKESVYVIAKATVSKLLRFE